MSTSTSFSTEHEIEFIRSLGTNNKEAAKMPRHQLLRNYITASRKRVNWGAIDRSKAIGFACEELDRGRVAA